MREIKFRILMKAGDGWEWSYFNLPADLGFDKEIYLHSENYRMDTFSQSTGLKDKNGKEIYEGDIVEYQYISTKEIGVVEYDPQSTLYGPTVCEVDEGCWSVLVEKETKVIGNVWENPDLLATNK